jgi:hypothetical protein
MGTDIDEIKRRIGAAHPRVRVEHLRATHPADDDGLWFFRVGIVEVQLESSSGDCPFLVESSEHPTRRTVATIDEAVAALEEELHLF